MDAALLTAIVSLITALSGIIFTIVRIQRERDERRREFQSELAELEVKFIHERIAQRYKIYSKVFKVLGAVRDVSEPDRKHHKSLLQNKEQLEGTAHDLLLHLYGDAGLIMEIPTRNALLNAWLACHLFQTGDVNLNQLIGYFFYARRRLRADLGIDDVEEVQSELEKIRKKYGLDTSDEKMTEFAS